VREAVHVSRTEDETSAKLKRILPELHLPMPRCASSLARHRVIAPKKMQEIGVAQLRHAVSLPLLINEQRKGDSRLFAENSRVVAVAQSDGRQRRSFIPEGLLVFAQLRDMLAAKNSSIVAQKNNHGRLAGPQ